ncbi:MAG: YbaK/EbsC family protein [Patescibacteria group bacterium]
MECHLVVQKIRDLLESRQIKYDCFEHESVRTSEEASKIRSGYTLKQGAKALVVKLYLRGGVEKFVMLVVPGDAKFDSKKVKKMFDAKDLRFATEKEVGDITGGVLVGGVPPFGSLFGLQTYIDHEVEKNDRIIFNAGDRRVSVALAIKDYISTENPVPESLV